MSPEFSAIIARARAESAAIEKLVTDALDSPRQRLALIHTDGRARILHRSTYGAEYRVTDLDSVGPVGHRDYNRADTRGMAQEIASAIRSGYTIRTDWQERT